MNKLLILVCTMLGVLSFGQTCNIEQEQIVHMNYAQSTDISFQTWPNNNLDANAYNYKWVFSYENGMTTYSDDHHPIIPVACTNRVTVAKVTIYNGTCSKVIHREFRPKVCGTTNIFN